MKICFFFGGEAYFSGAMLVLGRAYGDMVITDGFLEKTHSDLITNWLNGESESGKSFLYGKQKTNKEFKNTSAGPDLNSYNLQLLRTY